jgi:hypothetical protein
MKKVLFILVILMTAAVSSASARTNNDFSNASASVAKLPIDIPGDLDLVAADGDIIYATVAPGVSFTWVFFDRPINVATIEFFRRRPLELHNFTVNRTANSVSLPFVTSEAKWEVTLITTDGKQYKGKVLLEDAPSPSPWPDPWIIK